MNDHEVGHAIAGIEQRLARDDPAFVRRFRAVHRAEIATNVSVFLLLTLAAVLLTVGLALPSWPSWIAGMLTLVISAVVDEHHKHALRRPL